MELCSVLLLRREFLVLIAALLELKSRLMLPAAEDAELDLGPEEAADELLARMLEYRRYKDAGAGAERALRGASARYLYRSAPLPLELRRVSLEAARPAYDPDRLGLGARRPAAHAAAAGHEPHPPDRLAGAPARRPARAALAAPRRVDFDDAFGGEDRLTQAVTIFALLEMHKKGEATWTPARRTSGRSRSPAAGREKPERGGRRRERGDAAPPSSPG